MAAKKIPKSSLPAASVPPPPSVLDLAARFAEQADAYREGHYKETPIRREFIDPLLKALGWDIDNTQGYAEAYKDVIHEDAIKIGGATKAPDYCFRIGGVRKFFVEAKKPSVDIRGDVGPAFQLRRYAWSAKLPLSILTDFEELAVYDCRVKPAKTDKASTARVMYFRYDQYADRWGELAGVFSRQAILKGSFDKYAASMTRKKGTAEVDDAFLAEIEQWRDTLARNLALRNDKLSQRELNFAVQRTIDRIVFLRICEDRGIERYGTLQGLINGPGVYRRLFERFRRADERYNSGLFHFETERGRPRPPDELTPSLAVDDKQLRDIIQGLYYPESPYEFSVLPADILGQVYEQFLGKVIRLTRAHHAKVEEKPEVRKAGGVYYTPTYIVDYIVRNTVGKLVEGRTPQQVGGLTKTWRPGKQARPIAVLDPACGSGSFLLGAYQFLLDWYRDRYVEDGPKKHAGGKNPRLYQHASGEWRLTTAERKRILLAHIYGVDIDSQAVETTKLSLLLKVLEGESGETLSNQLRMFHERALPDLSENIKCGNSLIGQDFYDCKQKKLFDEDELFRINRFDWEKGFAEIFSPLAPRGRGPGGEGPNAGFDAVIGNPPYVNIQNIPKSDRQYFITRYGENGKLGKRYDIYQVFVLRGIALLKEGAFLGMILPNTFLMGHSYKILRKRISEETAIRQCVDLPQGVFHGVTVDNILLFLQRSNDPTARKGNKIVVNKLNPKSQKTRVSAHDWDESYCLPQRQLAALNDFKLNVHANPRSAKVFKKIESLSICLAEVTESSQGIILYKTSADAKRSEHTGFQQQRGWKRLLRGKNIGRYETKWGREFVRYGPCLWCAREEKFFARPKILLHAMRNKSLARRLVATYDADGYYNAHNLANIIAAEDTAYDLKYVLGLFNSELLNWWYKLHFPNVNINPNDFRQLPIRAIDFSEPADKSRHDRMVQLVEQMLSLHKRLSTAGTPHEKTAIQRQIDAVDHQIDRLVYELYDLTDEEIAIVEDATHNRPSPT